MAVDMKRKFKLGELLVTSNREFLRFIVDNEEYGADVPAEPPVVWTDAFSSLYDVLGQEPD